MFPFEKTLFQCIFDQLGEARILINTDAPDYTVFALNQDIQKITFKGPEIIGERIRDVFKADEADPESVVLVRKCFELVMSKREKVKLPSYKYDIAGADGTTMQEVWWQVEYSPIIDDNDKVAFIMGTFKNITDEAMQRQESKRREELLIKEIDASNKQLIESNEELKQSQVNLQNLYAGLEEQIRARTIELANSELKLRSIFEQSPSAFCLFKGRELIIEYANKFILAIWGKNASDVLGKPLAVAIPELKGQIFLQLLDEVYTSEQPYHANELKARHIQAGVEVELYFDFVYYPIKDESGNITNIMASAIDVTERALSRQREQQLNEELMATNEELYSTNQELLQSQEKLQALNLDSKTELQFAIDAADLATFDLDPVTNRFSGNDRLKEWFGLDISRPLAYDKGIALIAKEDRNRVIEATKKAMTFGSGYVYDIEYTLINPNNNVARKVRAKGKALFNKYNEPVRFSGILQDITTESKAQEQLNYAGIEIERAYEQLRLSKEAAQLGTFDMDLLNRNMEWDDRCRLLFGITHNNPVTFENDFLPGLHDDDRERVIKVIEKAFIKKLSGGDYDVEYRTVGVEDNQLRWVRAKGKVFFNDDDIPVRFIGSVLEITDQKENELLKNDFIGMVSHELKTPLTSLKAYIQMLNKRAIKDGDSFGTNALGKVEVQINKMSTMINGFLNVARLESAKIHLIKSEFNIDKLLREVIEENNLVQSTHQITLSACDEIVVFADREKISHVINNLISNAVKYSPRGKVVEIHCTLAEQNVKVSVSDEGMGISVTDQAKLFSRFYRVESQHTRHISGFGIGLYLSAEIIRSHDGEIWVESEKGVGSTFHFTLPVNKN